MTLTDLRYLVALARERHFGHAAERCNVSQPTLSVAIKKLEEELAVTLFERSAADVKITDIGARIVAQAEKVLLEAGQIKEIATAGRDPLSGPLKLGVIYTIGPYLLPHLIPRVHAAAPSMPPCPACCPSSTRKASAEAGEYGGIGACQAAELAVAAEVGNAGIRTEDKRAGHGDDG